MKRIFAGAVIPVLILTLIISAFAVTNDGTAGTVIDVDAYFVAADEPDTVVAADVRWEDLTFTYQDGDKTWDVSKHEDIVGAGAWKDEQKAITVTNHSNTPINVTFAFKSEVDGLAGSFTKTVAVIDTAEETEAANAPSAESSFSVSGSAIDANMKLGTITVTVSEAVSVSTDQELLRSARNGGAYKLANDIDIGGSEFNVANKEYILDLNGFTVSGYRYGAILNIGGGSKVLIKNGTIKNTQNKNYGDSTAVIISGANAVIEKCDFISSGTAFGVNSGSNVRISNCSLSTSAKNYYSLLNLNSTLTLSAYVSISSSGFRNDSGNNIILPGTYNFDITAYVDKDTYTVTEDAEAGTWTVTEK